MELEETTEKNRERKSEEDERKGRLEWRSQRQLTCTMADPKNSTMVALKKAIKSLSIDSDASRAA